MNEHDNQVMDDGYIDDRLVLRSRTRSVVLLLSASGLGFGVTSVSLEPTGPVLMGAAIALAVAIAVGLYLGGALTARRIGGGVLLVESGRPGRWRVKYRYAPGDVTSAHTLVQRRNNSASWFVVVHGKGFRHKHVAADKATAEALVRRLGFSAN